MNSAELKWARWVFVSVCLFAAIAILTAEPPARQGRAAAAGRCSAALDPCASMDCGDGTCVGPTCECPDGYTGTNCEVEIDATAFIERGCWYHYEYAEWNTLTDTNSVENCLAACSDDIVNVTSIGLSWNACLCNPMQYTGSYFYDYYAPGACTDGCTGNASQSCGLYDDGSYIFTLYTIPTVFYLPDYLRYTHVSWSFVELGCYSDYYDYGEYETLNAWTGYNSIQNCLTVCVADLVWFGTIAMTGDDCVCDFVIEADVDYAVANDQCNDKCTGDENDICGDYENTYYSVYAVHVNGY